MSEASRATPRPRAGRRAADWAASVEGAWFDYRRHIVTAPTAEERRSQRRPSDDWSMYIPARPASARAALQALPVRDPRDYTLIDVGSGKGRVMFLAAEYPFRRIVGVESVGELHAAAERNIQRYRHRARRCPSIEAVHARAQDYAFPAEPLVLFFFNPFPADVMAQVMESVARSLEQHPRPIWLILLFPELAPIIQSVTTLRLHQQTRRFHIYASAQADR
ncbi:MAG: class I SAM-dependent methyltransferase [Vicinamibacteraceae bacterium]